MFVLMLIETNLLTKKKFANKILFDIVVLAVSK